MAATALLLAACDPEPMPPKTYTDTPLRGPEAFEVVAALDTVLGNIAVSPAGRVFITYHPEADPVVKVAEISAGSTSRPYPDEAWQERFQIFRDYFYSSLDRARPRQRVALPTDRSPEPACIASPQPCCMIPTCRRAKSLRRSRLRPKTGE
jgi:hypothetical protein